MQYMYNKAAEKALAAATRFAAARSAKALLKQPAATATLEDSDDDVDDDNGDGCVVDEDLAVASVTEKFSTVRVTIYTCIYLCNTICAELLQYYRCRLI